MARLTYGEAVAQTFRHESFLLELPFDLGLPDRYCVHVKDDADAPPTSGWEDFDLDQYLGLSGYGISPNLPSTTLMFKLAKGPPIRPWERVEEAWPRIFKWQRRGLGLPKRVLPSAPVRRARGMFRSDDLRGTVSVLQAVRLAPRPDECDEDWRWAQLAAALDDLNDVLSGIMSVRRDPEVTPIGLRDLPPLVLGFGWDLEPDGSRSRVEQQGYMANDRLPQDHPRMTREEADLAVAISGAKDHPIKAAGDYLLMGWSSAQRGRYGHAVAESATAIELLTSSAVRVTAPQQGYSEQRLANVLEGPFASLCRDHFAVIFAYERDPLRSSDALGRWWRDSYLLRNRVVHLGYRPTEPETVRALEAGEDLIRDLGARASEREDFEALAIPVPHDLATAADANKAGPVPRSFLSS